MKVDLDMCYMLCFFWNICGKRHYDGFSMFDCDRFKKTDIEEEEESSDIDFIGQNFN